MSISVKKTLIKTLKITGITVVSLILLVFALPYLFPQTISNKIKQLANERINGSLAFSSTGLSFFKHFPTLTLTLYDVSLKGSAPFEKDTLVAAKELSFGIDLATVLQKKITIDKIYLTQAFINIQADSLGHVNYNVYKSTGDKAASPADTASASLGIDQILIENSRFVYNDESLPMKFVARGVNYNGKGDLSKDVFDLYTHTEMQSVDFYYNRQAYVLSKKLNADLITKINTKSLAFIFQKNDLLLNKLPVQFNGRFAFLKNGYDMDFKVNSHESALHDMITALPAEYLKYFDNTELKGTGNVKISLAGKYMAADSIMPDLAINVQLRDGYINNKKSPAPGSNIYLNFDTKLPGLDPDSLQVNLDSLYFKIGKDYFSSIIKVKGVKTPEIYAKINTEIDLEKWNKAFGVKAFDVKGRYALHLLANGRYAKEIRKIGKGKADTVITSIPKFSLQSSFANGYFKYAQLPEALKNISFNLDAACPDNDIKHASISFNDLSAYALDNYIKGYFKLNAAPGYPMDADLKAKFNLADIKQFYPIGKYGVDLTGNLLADVHTKGKYLPVKKIFPVINANLELKNGSIQTKYYPHPIQNIQVSANIVNSTGSLKGLKVDLKPVSFTFEDKPFMIKANLKNFDNLDYNVISRGTIDVGKIYQVFAVKGYNVKGTIQANLALKGKQSDAMAGRYDKLANSGTLKVKNIALTSDLFPKPFLISSGAFSFNQDKMQFDEFKATYGRSVIILNGSLTNVLAYAVKPGAILKGDFNFGSSVIIADDFMAFAGSTPVPAPKSGPSGVIMVPKTLDLNLTADVKKVKYSGTIIKDVKGNMAISNGSIILKQTGFIIADAPVTMDATYTSLSPQKATFDYHINAKEFDIKKAYKQVKMLREMATSAANAEGIVSLDYKLGGRLNSNMQPVLPSLKGGGVLSLKKVKLKGFKLFGAVGSKTDHKGIDSGDVSKVDIETTIANNIITIKRTKMRMAGFRLRFEGQVSFNNALNLNFRLGLPPLGILGIPMNITGTESKPKIHLGSSKKTDELPEEADQQ